MIRLNLTDTATPALRAAMEKLSPEGRARLNKAAGARITRTLVDHFRAREKEPNKRGWAKQHYWSRIAKATALVQADEKQATVTVADTSILLKIFGGTVKPKTAQALAIPMREEAYGKMASEWPDDTFFRFVSKSGKAFLAKREGNALRLYYRLVKSVRHKPDPRAIPPIALLMAEVEAVAVRHLGQGKV